MCGSTVCKGFWFFEKPPQKVDGSLQGGPLLLKKASYDQCRVLAVVSKWESGGLVVIELAMGGLVEQHLSMGHYDAG